MARKDRASKSKKGVSVDLSKVEIGGKAIPEGQYTVSINSATIKTSANSGGDYISMEFEVTEGKHKGAKLFHNCSLQPQALFSLKAVLLAVGFEIPKKAFDLDLEALIGLECTVETSHELYEGKKKSKITDFITEESEEEETESEDDEDEDVDYSEMTVEELQEECKEREIKISKTTKALKGKKLIAALIELLEEDDGEEEEEEEESEDESDDEDVDYSEMELDELVAECKERGIKTGKKAKKKDLIKLLEEDDED